MPMTRRLRQVSIPAALMLALLLCGCQPSLVNAPLNQPLKDGQKNAALLRPASAEGQETFVALAFSGGGLRSTAFSFGVLQALAQTPTKEGSPLIDDVRFITSVSAGSITAAYFGLHGIEGLKRFREHVLMSDGEAEMRLSGLNPMNLFRMIQGGINDRSNLNPWLDEHIFKGATFADMYRNSKATVWISATNMYYRTAFPFHEVAFDLICSNLASLPIAEAVKASMSVPLAFAPVVLRTYPEHCPTVQLGRTQGAQVDESADSLHMRAALRRALRDYRDPNAGRFLKLYDGGLIDNNGLLSLLQFSIVVGAPYAPLNEEDAVSLRKLLFVVVNAGQAPSGNWTREPDGPSGAEAFAATLDVMTENSSRLSADNFGPMMQGWRSRLVSYRCGLDDKRKAALTAKRADWACDDVTVEVTYVAFSGLGDREEAKLSAIPTRLKLPIEQVDMVIDGAHRLVRGNAVIQGFARN